MARPKKVRDGDAVLTQDSIVETAMRLADADGITKLSMRRLATELDCGVMSLYHYIADKEALIEALVDQIACEIERPAVNAGWRQAVREIATLTLEAQLRHPWAIPVWSTAWPGPCRLELVELLLESLASADLPADIADLGFHAVTNHIQGFAQQRISFGQLESRAEITAERVTALLAADAFPRVAEHIAFHQSSHPTHDEFSFTLDLILDGLERYAGS